LERIVDEFTEELLSIHEDEITRLKEERRAKAPLLASIRKYFEICEEEKELAAAASDQTRLLGRGVRGDPGRLLREEKMRKRVNKEKPRVSTLPSRDAVMANGFTRTARAGPSGNDSGMGTGSGPAIPGVWREHSEDVDGGSRCHGPGESQQ
jgi:hypothetical protein